MLEDIDRIQIIVVPGGRTIWGANAVDGVINIITKSAKDTQGTLVTAGTGNVDEATVAARYGGNPRGELSRSRQRIRQRGGVQSEDNNFDQWRRGNSDFVPLGFKESGRSDHPG